MLGYTIPAGLSRKIGAEKIRLYVNGLNLLTWDKFKIVDPERGNGFGAYPPTRILNMGLNMNF